MRMISLSELPSAKVPGRLCQTRRKRADRAQAAQEADQPPRPATRPSGLDQGQVAEPEELLQGAQRSAQVDREELDHEQDQAQREEAARRAPMATPSSRKGMRMKALVAPTSRRSSISDLRARTLSLMTLEMMSREARTRMPPRKKPALRASRLRERTRSAQSRLNWASVDGRRAADFGDQPGDVVGRDVGPAQVRLDRWRGRDCP